MIFEKQKDLMKKYHPIEMESGLMQTDLCPVDLDSPFGQARIKDFAWRFVEELGEAISALVETDYKEELIDGLHFLVELSILVGREHTTVVDKLAIPGNSDMDILQLIYHKALISFDTEQLSQAELIRYIIREVAMMCNELKNKPWKQTHRPTNTEFFYARLENLWTGYFALLVHAGFSVSQIHEGYLDKNSINLKRQQDKY